MENENADKGTAHVPNGTLIGEAFGLIIVLDFLGG